MSTELTQDEKIEAWCTDLESGKFEQGTGYLLRAGRYCCLGVLCETYERLTGEKLERTTSSYKTVPTTLFNGRDARLPDVVRVWAGLKGPLGEYVGDSLSKLNDGGASFGAIVAVIRSKPEGLAI